MSTKNDKGKGRGQNSTMNKPPTKGNTGGSANGAKSNDTAPTNSQANSANTQQSANANSTPAKSSWASITSSSLSKQATAPAQPKTVKVDLKGATSAPPTKQANETTPNSQPTVTNSAPTKQSSTTAANLPTNSSNNTKEQTENKQNTSANAPATNAQTNTTQPSNQNEKEKATNALPNGTNPTATPSTSGVSANTSENTATTNPSNGDSNPLASPAPKSATSSALKTSTVSPSLNAKAPTFKPSGNPPVPQRTHSAPPSLEEQQQQYGSAPSLNPNVPTFSPGYTNGPYPAFAPQKHFYYPYPPYQPSYTPLFVPPQTSGVVPPAQMQNSMGPVPLGNNSGNFNTGINPSNYNRFPAPVPAPVPTTPPPVNVTPSKRIAIIDPNTGKEVSGSSPPKNRPTPTSSSNPPVTPNSQFAPTVVPSPSTNTQKSVTGPGGILPELGTMNQNKEIKHEEKVEVKPKETPIEHKALHFDTPDKSEKKPVPSQEPTTPLKKSDKQDSNEEEEEDWEIKKEEKTEVKEQKEDLNIPKVIIYTNNTMWSPSNPTGLRVYDRLFMEQFKEISTLKDKPDEMLSIEDLMEEGEKDSKEVRRDGSGQWKSQAPPGFSPRDKSDRGKLNRSESGRINKDGSVSSPSNRRGGRGGRGGMQSPMNKSKSNSNLNGPPLSPIAPLEKSENRWQTSREKDVTDIESILRKVISILNKITEETFEALSVKLLKLEINSEELLKSIIKTFFDKAVWEPKFCSLYAELCRRLAANVNDFPVEGGKPITFKRLLLNRCQEEFETIFKANKKETTDADGNPLPQKELTREEKLLQEEEEMLAKKRMMGNVIFIGELYKIRMLTEKIMHECIRRLLGDLKNPSEIDMEALCKLMTSIGYDIDHAKAKAYMDQYFARMKELSKNNALSSRIRFMLQDVLILRENNWVARVIGSGVTKEVEKSERPEKTEKPKGKKKNDSNNSEDEWEVVGSGKFTGNPKRPTQNITVTAIAQPPRYQTLANNSGSTPLSSSPSSSDDNPILRPNISGLGRGAKGWSQNSGKNQPVNAPKTVNVKLPTKEKSEKPVEDNSVITDEIENKMELTIEEYLSSNDLEEAIACVNEFLIPNGSKAQTHFILKCVQTGLDKKDKDRVSLAKLINTLFTTTQFHSSHFVKAVGEIMETLEDLKIDIPQSPQFVAYFVANGLANNYLSLDNVHTLMNPLQSQSSEEKPTYPNSANFMGDIFHSLTSLTKEAKVREIYYKNEINFSKYLASNEDSLLLHFLEDKNIASVLAPLTLELMIRMKNPLDEIVAWVEDNIGEEGFTDPNVIRRLIGFVVTIILNEGDKTKIKESLQKYSRLLNTFLMDNIPLQAQSLFEIELVLHNLTHSTNGSKYSKELLEGVYSALYDTKLIAGKAFLIWVDAKDENESIRKEVQVYAQTVLATIKSSRGSNYGEEEDELEVEDQD